MRADKSQPRQSAPEIVPNSDGADQAGVIDQVRELLFGATKRSTDDNLSHLDNKLEALRASMLERFSEVESRLADLARETERSQSQAIDNIGGAIQQLGASIRNMSGVRKAN
jgi:hypothetical protein